jgi:hypothetical protein
VHKHNEKLEGKNKQGAHRAVALKACAVTADTVLSLGAGVLLIHAAWPSDVAAWGGMHGLLLVIRLLLIIGLLVVIMLHAGVSVQNT